MRWNIYFHRIHRNHRISYKNSPQNLPHLLRKFTASTFVANFSQKFTQKPRPGYSSKILRINFKHRFVRYKDQVGHLPKQPWGRDRSYAGLGSLMLPDSHRPKAEPPVFVAKGHKHFGSGIFPYPTYLDRSSSFDFNSETARRTGYPDSPMKRTSDPIVFSRYYRPANPVSENMDPFPPVKCGYISPCLYDYHCCFLLSWMLMIDFDIVDGILAEKPNILEHD